MNHRVIRQFEKDLYLTVNNKSWLAEKGMVKLPNMTVYEVSVEYWKEIRFGSRRSKGLLSGVKITSIGERQDVFV